MTCTTSLILSATVYILPLHRERIISPGASQQREQDEMLEIIGGVLGQGGKKLRQLAALDETVALRLLERFDAGGWIAAAVSCLAGPVVDAAHQFDHSIRHTSRSIIGRGIFLLWFDTEFQCHIHTGTFALPSTLWGAAFIFCSPSLVEKVTKD
jgi:hypothetical protein